MIELHKIDSEYIRRTLAKALVRPQMLYGHAALRRNQVEGIVQQCEDLRIQAESSVSMWDVLDWARRTLPTAAIDRDHHRWIDEIVAAKVPDPKPVETYSDPPSPAVALCIEAEPPPLNTKVDCVDDKTDMLHARLSKLERRVGDESEAERRIAETGKSDGYIGSLAYQANKAWTEAIIAKRKAVEIEDRYDALAAGRAPTDELSDKVHLVAARQDVAERRLQSAVETIKRLTQRVDELSAGRAAEDDVAAEREALDDF